MVILVTNSPSKFGRMNKRERRFERLIATADRLLEGATQISTRFSRWRMAIFVIGLATTVILYKLALFHTGNATLALFIATFLVVAWYHNRLEARMHRLRLWRNVKSANLARLRLDWDSIPKDSSPTSESHAYAADLDLLGPRSLFTLLNTTLSSNGRDTLAKWLLDQNTRPPDPQGWGARQILVKELAPLSGFRDRLIVEASLVGEQEIDGRRILSTLQAPAGFSGLLPVLGTQSLLAACTISLGFGAALGWFPSYWMFSFTPYAIIYFLTSGRAAPAFSRALTLHDELEKLGAIFKLLKARSFVTTPSIKQLLSPLLDSPQRPDLYITRFARVSHSLSVRAHALVHLALNAVVPWDLLWTYRLEQLQRQVLPEIPTWLDTLAELEASAALGNFAFLNPEYTWPILVQPGSNGRVATLVARDLGHPMIPPAQRVTNDVELTGQGRIFIVTGSNMSGKSTFLRTVGMNACLAQAGAPVCARSFEASWMRLFCCIRVDDSLEAGLSFFYAEVKRLKQVLDATQDTLRPPVLFLIDEIFKGTNNRERVIGSRAFIRALAGNNAFGLVTTHDLELAELEKEIPTASNAHFREGVEARTLTFDYRLRPGPCPTTNALRIMAIEGLPVADPGTN